MKCEFCEFDGELRKTPIGLICEECYRLDSKARETQQKLAALDKQHAELQTINYNGDIFNTKLMSFIELKNAIDSDESVATDQKDFTYQAAIAERIEHLQKTIFERDQQNHEDKIEILAANKTLRELGAELRAEIRERIKQSDDKYNPIIKKVNVDRVVKQGKKLSPFDKLAQSIALAKGISMEEAKRLMEKKGI